MSPEQLIDKLKLRIAHEKQKKELTKEIKTKEQPKQ